MPGEKDVPARDDARNIAMEIAETENVSSGDPELSRADKQSLGALIDAGWRDAFRHARIPWDRPRDRDLFEALRSAVWSNAMCGVYSLTATTSALQRHMYLRLSREDNPAAFSRTAVMQMRSRWRRSICEWSKTGTIDSKKTGVSFTLLPEEKSKTLVVVSVPGFLTERGERIDIRGRIGDVRAALPDIETLRPREPDDPIARAILIDWCVTTAPSEKKRYRAALESMPLLDIQEHVLDRAHAARDGNRFDVAGFLLLRETAAGRASDSEEREKAKNVRAMQKLVEQDYASASLAQQHFAYQVLRAVLAGTKKVAIYVLLPVVFVGAATFGALALTDVLGMDRAHAAIIRTINSVVKRVWSRAALDDVVRDLDRASEHGTQPGVATARNPETGDATQVWFFPNGQYGRRTHVKDLSVHLPDIKKQLGAVTPATRVRGRTLLAQMQFLPLGPRDVAVFAYPEQRYTHDLDLHDVSVEGGPTIKASFPWMAHVSVPGVRLQYALEPQIVRAGGQPLYQVLTRVTFPNVGTYRIFAYLGHLARNDSTAVDAKWQIEAVVRVDADGTVIPVSQEAHLIK
jgi:hypothetical protein